MDHYFDTERKEEVQFEVGEPDPCCVQLESEVLIRRRAAYRLEHRLWRQPSRALCFTLLLSSQETLDKLLNIFVTQVSYYVK